MPSSRELVTVTKFRPPAQDLIGAVVPTAARDTGRGIIDIKPGGEGPGGQQRFCITPRGSCGLLVWGKRRRVWSRGGVRIEGVKRSRQERSEGQKEKHQRGEHPKPGGEKGAQSSPEGVKKHLEGKRA